MSESPRRRLPRITRDTVLLAGGFIGVMREVFFGGVQERPQLLILLAGMMGLPVMLRRDEAKKDTSR